MNFSTQTYTRIRTQAQEPTHKGGTAVNVDPDSPAQCHTTLEPSKFHTWTKSESISRHCQRGINWLAWFLFHLWSGFRHGFREDGEVFSDPFSLPGGAEHSGGEIAFSVGIGGNLARTFLIYQILRSRPTFTAVSTSFTFVLVFHWLLQTPLKHWDFIRHRTKKGNSLMLRSCLFVRWE